MKHSPVDYLWNSLSRGRAVMAIVNATPDSFYAASRLDTQREAIVARVEAAIAQGAQILDVGGYSSRPGAAEVSPREEIERIEMAIRVIRERFPETPVSLDTFRASVAEAIIARFGPCIINDISAGELDAAMIPLVAELQVPYIAMHMRGTPADMASRTAYRSDIVREVCAYFAAKIEQLHRAGVERIVIDPGFGFAKTLEQNYRLMGGLHRLTEFGLPVLAGVSRKSMIYNALTATPADALAGTCALNWEALRQGATILRVHDVAEAVDIAKLHEYFCDHGK